MAHLMAHQMVVTPAPIQFSMFSVQKYSVPTPSLIPFWHSEYFGERNMQKWDLAGSYDHRMVGPPHQGGGLAILAAEFEVGLSCFGVQ